VFCTYLNHLLGNSYNLKKEEEEEEEEAKTCVLGKKKMPVFNLLLLQVSTNSNLIAKIGTKKN
jgi:hypothetical protein